MARCFPPLSIVLVLLSVPLASAQSPRSPFLPPATREAPAAASEDAPLQFSGYVGQGENARYCIYDPAKRRAMWLPMGGEQGSVELQGVDRENGTVTVAQNGRVMTLKLQAAKVSGTAGPPKPLPVASTSGPAPAGSSPPNVTAADEARRLEAVAAEVRRRRALRQAASQDQQQRTPAAEPTDNPPRNGR